MLCMAAWQTCDGRAPGQHGSCYSLPGGPGDLLLQGEHRPRCRRPVLRGGKGRGRLGPRIARLILCRAQTPGRATCKEGNGKGPDTSPCPWIRSSPKARALPEGLRSRHTYGSTSMELFRPRGKVRIIPGRRWKSMPSLEQVRRAAPRPPGMLIPL